MSSNADKPADFDKLTFTHNGQGSWSVFEDGSRKPGVEWNVVRAKLLELAEGAGNLTKVTIELDRDR